ncbi:type VI secretion system Vgr family protein [Luteimonas sp. A501]
MLASLAQYVGTDRLYQLEGDALPADCAVERWQGWEQLSLGYEWWVDVLSSDASWALDELLGTTATLATRLADGSSARRSGVIREASCLGGDGGLVRYRLCLVPWTWWMTQGRHSRVFQDKSVIGIVEAVFEGYAPLAQWQLSDEVGPFIAEAHPRSYCVQYRETDFDFVSRLLAEEGLGWRWEEDAEAPAGHRLVIFADSTTQPEDAIATGGGIRFHRDDATEAQDTIHAIGTSRRVGSAKLSMLGTDYRSVQAVAAQLPLGADSAPVYGESYDPSGAYAFADAAQASRHARLLGEAREAGRRRWQGQGGVRSFRAGTAFTLTDAPRNAEDVDAFFLQGLRHAGRNNLPDTVRDGLVELLGPAPGWPALPQVLPLDTTDMQQLWQHADAHGYANAFQSLPRALPWRPRLHDDTGTRLNPRPTAPGYQSAIVVADDGGHDVLSSDALGRIKVKFHWQAGGQATAERSCWLRVSQRYAGPGVGAQFLPRVGQEVLVAFLEGDIDRPVVVGALYNGQGEAGLAPTAGGKEAAATGTDLYAQASDHGPSAQANLAGGHAPPWHGMGGGDDAHRNASALWGIQSQEWHGSGHNRLLFDDSDGQLRLQLATTQAATQLTLGHLIHQADNYRGSFRGEGFELRTDAWGTVRAERGLWLSAYATPGETPAGDAVGPAALLKQAQTVAEVFSGAAGTHLTVKLAGHEGVGRSKSSLIDDQAPLAALLTSAKTAVPGDDYDLAKGEAADRSPAPGDCRVPHTGDPILGLAAPAGIVQVAGQSLHWAAGETLTLASGQASNLAVASNLRLHTGQAIGWLVEAVDGAPTEEASLSLVTGEGELDIQAQHDQIKLQAKDQLKIVSANAEVEFAAGKTVHLATSGGASLTIEGGNITVACPGEIKVHAGKKSFLGPAHLSREMNSWPESKFDEKFRLVQRNGKPAANYRYEIERADGARIQGVTDPDGWTPLQKGVSMDGLLIRLLGPADKA